jgi:hypothetical protein
MKEKDYQTIFNHWLKEKYKKTSCFELKKTDTLSLPFSAVVPHQIEALKNANEGVLVYKIPDMGFRTPFDCFSFFRVPAYIVIKYPLSFELIPINNFIHEKERSKRKSLTYERACSISTISIPC